MSLVDEFSFLFDGRGGAQVAEVKTTGNTHTPTVSDGRGDCEIIPRERTRKPSLPLPQRHQLDMIVGLAPP